MLQAGEQALLAQQTLQVRAIGVAQQFDRDLLLEAAVYALRQPDLAHAAASQAPLQTPRAKFPSAMVFAQCRGFEKTLGRVRGLQQRQHLGAHFRVIAFALKVFVALLWRQVQRGVQQDLDTREALRRGIRDCRPATHAVSALVALGADSPSSRYSQARALTQSRRTVRSVIPRARAVSVSV